MSFFTLKTAKNFALILVSCVIFPNQKLRFSQQKHKIITKFFPALQMGVLRFFTGFAFGVYAGLYISKNYEVPYIPPEEILEKLKKLSEEYKKDKPDK